MEIRRNRYGNCIIFLNTYERSELIFVFVFFNSSLQDLRLGIFWLVGSISRWGSSKRWIKDLMELISSLKHNFLEVTKICTFGWKSSLVSNRFWNFSSTTILSIVRGNDDQARMFTDMIDRWVPIYSKLMCLWRKSFSFLFWWTDVIGTNEKKSNLNLSLIHVI